MGGVIGATIHYAYPSHVTGPGCVAAHASHPSNALAAAKVRSIARHRNPSQLRQSALKQRRTTLSVEWAAQS
jgi:hypothetical protein